MLHHVEVHRKEPGLQGGTECVPLHQANLCIGRLVSEQMLLRWDHVLEYLEEPSGVPLTNCPSTGKDLLPRFSTETTLESLR
jgi:hypothetical protein